MLKAEDLLPQQEMTWPSEDLGSRRLKNSVPPEKISAAVENTIKKELIEDVMDVDDLPPPVDDLSG